VDAPALITPREEVIEAKVTGVGLVHLKLSHGREVYEGDLTIDQCRAFAGLLTQAASMEMLLVMKKKGEIVGPM
jgi:hypothetical protein